MAIGEPPWCLRAAVRFYLNRYRAVVWLYLAEELRQFAADSANASLLVRPHMWASRCEH